MCTISRDDGKAMLAELIGMMLFVFVGVGVAHQQFRAQFDNLAGGGADVSMLTISFAFGLGITCFVCVCAGPSGGHLNPAVTFTLMILKEISVPLGFLYVLMQCIGATLGAIFAALADPYLAGFALNVVTPYKCGSTWGAFGNVSGCCQQFDCNVTGSPLYNADLVTLRDINLGTVLVTTNTNRWGPAFVVEFLGTFMLCFTVLLTAVYKKSVVGNLAPLAIGLSVFFAHLIAIPITNCSINPARSFGAAVAASIMPYYTGEGTVDLRVVQAWEQMVFFWAVPIAGGLLAALFFYCFFLDREEGEGDSEGAGEKEANNANNDTSSGPPSAAASPEKQVEMQESAK